MNVGKFITFEGGEGVGKSTQVKRLADGLRKAGIDVIQTREPGGAPGAEEIRKLLVTGAVDRWRPETELLLNYGARVEHVAQTIRPALAAGTWVISDRFHDSSTAYQGYGHGLAQQKIDALHRLLLDDFVPDVTLILDVQVAVGILRTVSRSGNENRYERMDTAFHQRLRCGFLQIAKAAPERCVVIDAGQSIKDVFSEVVAAISWRLGITL
jgi:dTMP kinase